MSNIFKRIIEREAHADIVYETEHVLAFKDLDPKAPVHILIIPKQEISGLAAVPETGDHMHILNAARAIAEQEGLTGGYRLVINQGEAAGQSVPHLHAHLLGGRRFGWPPG